MSNLIRRQDAIDLIEQFYAFESKSEQIALQIAMRDLPSAQHEPKRGKWVRDGHHIRCDQCGMYMCDTDREGDRIPTEFCPNCGADMRGEQYG